jgi:NNP family nitrate/nitrite transporter-like MFS transporter
MMGSVIFPILKYAFGGDSNPNAAEQAWRIAFVFPATLGLIMGSLCWKYSDDCPKGNYIKREKQNLRAPVSAFLSLTSACWEFNTWIFVVQYACCFGVEFAMNNAAPLYFRERFDLTTEASAAVASIFGFLNLFARGMGGFVSDVCNARYGMRGRILWMFVILLLQGCSIVMFGYAKSLGGAITVMVIFSLFVQAAEGSVYAIVPYVNPSATGSISGVVGAGGTVGGAVFAVLFREYSWETAFVIMGFMVAGSSLLSFLLRIRGFEHTFYFCKPKSAAHARTEGCPDTVETNMELLTREENRSSDIDFDHL